MDGELLRMAECACCGEQIEQAGDDRPMFWTHTSTGSPYCELPRFATPATRKAAA